MARNPSSINELSSQIRALEEELARLEPIQRQALQSNLQQLLPSRDEGPSNSSSNDTLRVLDEIPALIWRAGLDSKCNYFNKSWLVFTGRSLEKEIGDGWTEGVHPEDLEHVQQVYQAAFQQRQPFEIEYRLCHHSGEYRWILDIGRPIKNEAGEFSGFVGTCYDMSERKKMERALQSREAMFKALFEYAPDAVIGVNEASQIILFNRQAQEMFGYTPQEIQAQLLEVLIPGDFRSRHQRHVQGYLRAPRVRPMGVSHELFGLRKNGDFFPVDITLGPLNTEEGTLVLATIRDISDRRQAEKELSLYREHLEELVQARTEALQKEISRREQAERSLQSYADRLARSNRDLEAFASTVSHDLQEPLRKIQAFGERLRARHANALETEGLDYLERMENAASRMQSLLNNLLAYSRISTKTQPFETVDLNEIVSEVISDLEVRLEQSQGEIEVGSLPILQADPLQMRQLFQNLIGNALKFHQPDKTPEVRVYAAEDEQHHFLMVEDNGIGFDPDYTEKIFQPFQRLHGRGEFEGSGMGLAICHKIVERHNGNITVASSPNEGTRFVVELPKEA